MSRTKNIIGRLPHFYQSDEEGNHLYRLASVFAALLDEAEEDLLKVMRAHWVHTADNEGSKGFDTNQKGDLDKILSLYLENLGGTSLLRQTKRKTGDQGVADDRIYRERMMGLVQVLLNGASTKEGIRQIVGANLGILGEEKEAVEARRQIRIVEYLPEVDVQKKTDVVLLSEITVHNPNPERTSAEIILTIKGKSNTGSIKTAYDRPRVVDSATGAFWQYPGTVVSGDELRFFPDGTGLYQGASFKSISGAGGLIFQPGHNAFFADAGIGMAKGVFDFTPFDYTLFEAENVSPIGSRFDSSRFDEDTFYEILADIEIRMEHLHPASFAVVIPWAIEGYTVDKEGNDAFGNLAVNPRSQIKYIVEKVKAAGTYAVVVFEKHLCETHIIEDKLQMSANMRPLTHTLEDNAIKFKAEQSPLRETLEVHGMQDTLLLSGVFDFTRFDSKNGFG